jgi:hypothetical protein
MTFGLRKCHKEFTALKDVSFDIWVKPLASSAVVYSPTRVGSNLSPRRRPGPVRGRVQLRYCPRCRAT